jgi:hypothetical protein
MRFAGNKILAALFSRLFLAATANAGVELGIDVLESNGFALLKGKLVGLVNRQLHRNLIVSSSRGKREMFFKCYGSTPIQSEFARVNGPDAIVAGWADDVVRFKGDRSQYLLY